MKKTDLKLLIIIGGIFIFVVVIIICFNINTKNGVALEQVKEDLTIDTSDADEEKMLFVEIKGAVEKPGVYKVSEGSRIIDVVDMAGGFIEGASTRYINLSKKVYDEMDIIIYTNEEVNSTKEINTVVIEKECVCPSVINDACLKNITDNNLISINDAGIDDLTKIPGIGDAKAKSIIEYRKNQRFEKIEDLMNIKGIGQGLFDTIKEYITI